MTLPVVDGEPVTMGRRVAALRALKGWTQEEVAARIGSSQKMMWSVEHDRSSHLDTLARLAALYGVTIDYLVHGEPVTG